MTQFEERVLRDLSELRANMRMIVGNGSEGKLHEIELRLQRNESVMHRMTGVGAALGGLLTVAHFFFDYLKVMRH